MPNTPARSTDTRGPAGRGFPRAFVGLAVAIYAIEIAAARSAAAVTHPVVPLAVTFDLVVFVPALYWLLVIRPAGASVTRVVAAFLLSLLGARFVLRPDQREYLRYARFLVAPFELALIAYVVVKVRRAARGDRAAGLAADVPERIAAALANAFPYRVVGQIFTTEMALAYYALCSWRHPPHVPAGADAFTFHRKSGLIGLLSAVIGASVVELFVAHLVVHAFNARLAWTFSAFSALGVIWLLGFTRAIVMRPVLVTARGAVVRSGVQWTLDVPFAVIDRVETGRVKPPARRAPEYLRIGGSGRASALIHLRDAVTAEGAYGRTKPVRTVSLTLDDATAFAQALRARGGVDA